MTTIGILSDSHGRAAITRRAIDALLERGATILIHLGDIERIEVIEALAGHEAHIVFGNTDWDEKSLARYARELEVIVDHPVGRLEIDGKTIIFTHGDDAGLVRAALDEKPGYFLHGHTHLARDERVEGTRIINPGALFRAARYTAALLEPAADRVEFIEIPRTDAA